MLNSAKCVLRVGGHVKMSFLCQFGGHINPGSYFLHFRTQKKNALKKVIQRFFFLRVKCFAVFSPEVTRNKKWPENFFKTEVKKNLWTLQFLIFVFFHCRLKMKYSCYQDSSVIQSWFVHLVFGLRPGGYSIYPWVGRCAPAPHTLTLFKTKIADFLPCLRHS